jgi:hypothetical protein
MDGSNAQMGNAISTFGDAVAASPESVAIAYVCGYAVGYDGRLFLLPASARLLRDTDVLTQGVAARLLASTVLKAGARAGFVLLDVVGQPGAAQPGAAQPGAGALPLDGLVTPASLGSNGLAALQTLGPMPAGPTPLAAAIAAVLASVDLEGGALLDGIREAVAGKPQLALAAFSPTAPAWINGGPVRQPVAAARPLPEPPPLPAAVSPGVVKAAPPPAPPSAQAVLSPAANAPAVLGDLDRRRVQLALQRLGYYAGAVDGVYGPESLGAIRRFQHELGAEMTGRLTNDQARRLLANAG